MSFGPSQAEIDSQQATSQYMGALPGYLSQSQNWMNQGFDGLNNNNADIRKYLGSIGSDSGTNYLRDYAKSLLSGNSAAQATAGSATAATASAGSSQATNVGMRGNTFASQFGSDLGGLALQSQNMQRTADKLADTTNNPFAVLTKGAMEDAAFQNAQGRLQLQSQLASQGLDQTSGSGAAALAALQFNTNKAVADAGRQNAVQGAQFQQQGLGMAGNLYNQLAGLDLTRATTAAQLGLQGYQADIGNAQRMDQVGMSNAQLATQANIANAGNITQASLANAQNATQASIANAGANNQFSLAGLQALAGLQNNRDAAIMQAYGLLSNNANAYLGAGQNMWNGTMGAYGNGVGMLNQNAMANAQGRGQLWGGLLQGLMGMGAAALTALR